jgi:DNA-binding MarR family transcriptional regulator
MSEIIILNFAEAPKPIFKEQRGKGYIRYGENNDLPDYLLDLFETAPKHGAIVGSKADYVFGKGWAVKGGNLDIAALNFIGKANPEESLNDLTRKITLDLEIFNGAYLNVIWATVGGKIAEIYHVPFLNMRTNRDNTQFWYKEEWKDRNEEAEILPAFDQQRPTGSQIYFIKGYSAKKRAYPLPKYQNGLNYIEAEVQVSKHTLGNAKTGFTPSKMISLFEGEPADDEMKKIERKFQTKFTGSDGKKFILAFPKSVDMKPQIDDLGTSDLTKEDFTAVNDLIGENVYSVHKVVTPSIFGINQPGKLGSRSEMRDGYEIFKNTYVTPQQQFIESHFNKLAKINGVKEVIELQEVEPVGIEFSPETIAAHAPKQWLFEKWGIDIAKYPPPMPAPPIQPLNPNQPPAPGQFSEQDIEVFAEYGEPKSSYLTITAPRKTAFRNIDDVAWAEDNYSEFLFKSADQQLTGLQVNILDLLSKDKRITPEVLAKTLEVEVGIVNKILRDFDDKGWVSTKTKGEVTSRELTKPLSEIKGDLKPKTAAFLIRYSYEGPQDDRNRAFCAKLMELGRLYSRSDIEQMSARLGYSVFDRRGGWYTNPNTDQPRPYCRHFWTSQVVMKNEQ